MSLFSNHQKIESENYCIQFGSCAYTYDTNTEI